MENSTLSRGEKLIKKKPSNGYIRIEKEEMEEMLRKIDAMLDSIKRIEKNGPDGT